MAILADYVIPPDKTPEDLAKDLEAMVSGVNTLSLQATTGTAVVVSPLAVAPTSSTPPLACSDAPATAALAPPSGLVSSTSASPPPASSVDAGSVSTAPSSRKRPLDQSDKAGALAGASGPDTGMPWLGVVILEPRQVLHALILSLVRMHRSPQFKQQGPCRCVVSSLHQLLP